VAEEALGRLSASSRHQLDQGKGKYASYLYACPGAAQRVTLQWFSLPQSVERFLLVVDHLALQWTMAF
jgi:hypothetical protein